MDTAGISKKRKLESDVETNKKDLNVNFMARAVQESLKSKDSKQVGAYVVDDKKEVVADGYNRYPMGCEKIPMDKENRLHYMLHAEANAILNKKTKNLRGCSMYVTLFPCNECAKMIVESGIKEVFYAKDKKKHVSKYKTDASKEMFIESGIDFKYMPADETEEFECEESEFEINEAMPTSSPC